ncbi:nuclear transport factor 2 family protein [Rhodococcus sp. WWJCD1]|uniref:nuclear transport factor 2 family protein n=1 Tax=Rhodococcus sp. WWJCD1 TaxID=2022519 RepID=UPI001595406B|nr:nuclear transport factor 2 family protein [Rhodococcus sp. WWJCD1]
MATASEVFAVIDSLDVEAFANMFAESGRLTFANGTTMIGPTQVRAGVDTFFTTIRGLHHEIVNEWQVEGTAITELEVTYDRLDGTSVTIPVATLWRQNPDGSFDNYRVFFDLEPVYA